MNSPKDYYELLGLTKDATASQIDQTYRKLALKYHPDRVAPENKKKAEEIFRKIVEAYYVLGHDQRRKMYDLQQTVGSDFKKPYESWGHQDSVEKEIFDQYFNEQRTKGDFLFPNRQVFRKITFAAMLIIFSFLIIVGIYSARFFILPQSAEKDQQFNAESYPVNLNKFNIKAEYDPVISTKVKAQFGM